MLIEVVYAECAFSALVYLITVVLLFYIFKLKSVKSLWKNSPPLLMLFLSTFILAVEHWKTVVLWIFVLAGLVTYPMDPVYTRIDQIASFWSKWFYDAATIGIFLQRVFLLVYPSRLVLNRKLAVVIVFLEVLIPILLVGVFQGLNLMNGARKTASGSGSGLGREGDFLSKIVDLQISFQVVLL
ncbi:hypothetical protein L596_019750 [Steinernema carpocapsae]|uniref:G-protein coupled receptors family 1 profile domain-containing protein n=1 Tax=Steinernema carpocapsae TaxID=34508 RepID=A0A4U5MRG9_STECR|nr:hypothetical protein L596_019750 [Steinernema carpocapsae]